jgi:endonuclease YncB( thermonuclease family)
MPRLPTAFLPVIPPAALLLAVALAGSTPRGAPQGPAVTPAPPADIAFSPLQLRQLVPAELVRVIDGDTIEVRALIWLDQLVTTRVRIRNIDAPELNARCPAEARLAQDSAAALARLLGEGRLLLTDIGRDKYGGRVLARVLTAGGRDAGDALRAAGLARAYAGKRREGWCG